jgi:hypothetical protein
MKKDCFIDTLSLSLTLGATYKNNITFLFLYNIDALSEENNCTIKNLTIAKKKLIS